MKKIWALNSESNGIEAVSISLEKLKEYTKQFFGGELQFKKDREYESSDISICRSHYIVGYLVEVDFVI